MWGAQGKNIPRGPGLAVVDFAVQKSIPVLEKKRHMFRMEAHQSVQPRPARPTRRIPCAANFGAIRSLQSGPRNLRAARFDF